MTTDRRALLAGLSTMLALAGCSNNPTSSSTPALLETDEVQNAMSALVDSVDSLKRSISEFGTANPKDVVPHVRAAAASVDTALTDLRMALGYADSN
jgi:hypothetical protein